MNNISICVILPNKDYISSFDFTLEIVLKIEIEGIKVDFFSVIYMCYQNSYNSKTCLI